MKRIHRFAGMFVLVTAMIWLGLLAPEAVAQATKPVAPAQQMILLKADDFNRSPKWERYVNYIQTNQLKASIGIICNVFEKNDPKLVPWTKEINAGGKIDFWHHGYDHRLAWKEGDKTFSEFQGTTYEHQKEHLAKGCAVIQEKVGIRFLAFGAGGNAVDATTAKVLAEHPDIKLVFYGPTNIPGKLVLPRWINLENPTFRPNSEAFIKAYPSRKDKPCLALQMHPNQWTEKDWAEFEKIIAFLKEQKVKFVTSAEAYAALTKN